MKIRKLKKITNKSENKQRNKVGDNKNKQNEKKKQWENVDRERLQKGQKIYFSGSSKVVPARPSSKGNLPLTLKYALTSFLIANTLLLYYKECLVGVP